VIVQSNVLARNYAGVQLSNCVSCNIFGNTVNGFIQGILLNAPGVHLVAGKGNTVNNNTASGHTHGISLFQETGARIYGNTVSGNDTGIAAESSLGVSQIFSNIVRGNGLDLEDQSACTAQTWASNTFFIANDACIH
jgi:parallel beta-helix repeat protein